MVGWLVGPLWPLWYCSVHCSGTVLALSGHCSSPAPALAWPVNTTPYMHSSNPVRCASSWSTLAPCHPGTPRTLHPAPGPAMTYKRCGTAARDTRGAHSGLQRWTDSRGMSPGPVLWPVYPADRHPLFATLCHLALARYGPLWHFSTN